MNYRSCIGALYFFTEISVASSSTTRSRRFASSLGCNDEEHRDSPGVSALQSLQPKSWLSRGAGAGEALGVASRQGGDGSSTRPHDLRLSSRIHVQVRPRAYPVAGKGPWGAPDAIWGQAESGGGRAVGCPTILRAVFCCGHASTGLAARASRCTGQK